MTLQVEALQESLLVQQQQLQSQAAEEQRRLEQQVSAALCFAEIPFHPDCLQDASQNTDNCVAH